MPFFSVIIPCYNVEDTIQKTINSVFNQTFKSFEIITINDGSSDNTATILNKNKKCSSFKIVSQNNRGLGAARNAGIKISEGRYICLLDADDLWCSNHLQRIYEFVETKVLDLISNDEIIYQSNKKISYLINKPPRNFKSCLLAGNTLSPSAMTIKREVFDSVGFFVEDKTFLGLEDWDFWLRCFLKKKIISHLDEPLGIYRRDGYNMSKESTFHEKTLLIYRLHSKNLIKKGELSRFNSIVGETFINLRRDLKNLFFIKNFEDFYKIFKIRNLRFLFSKLMLTLIIKFIYRQISIKIKNLKTGKKLKCIAEELL